MVVWQEEAEALLCGFGIPFATFTLIWNVLTRYSRGKEFDPVASVSPLIPAVAPFFRSFRPPEDRRDRCRGEEGCPVDRIRSHGHTLFISIHIYMNMLSCRDAGRPSPLRRGVGGSDYLGYRRYAGESQTSKKEVFFFTRARRRSVA